MATISFKEDIEIADNNKAKELAAALKQPRDSSIKSSQPGKLPENAGSIWFRRSDK